MAILKLGNHTVSPVITVEPNTQSLSITPSASQQVFNPPTGVDGFDSVTVSGVTSSIDSNIVAENIKKDVSILGVTGTYEGSGGIGIPREVSSNGVYQMPSSTFTFSLPEEAIDVGDYGLRYAFANSGYIHTVDLSSLTTISGEAALQYAFYYTYLMSINFSSLTTISGNNALDSAFSHCLYLSSVDLSNLTSITGSYALYNAFSRSSLSGTLNLSSLTTITGDHALDTAFSDCGSIFSINLSSLTTITGSHALDSAFSDCNLSSVDLSSLSSINGDSVLYNAFSNNGHLESLSFPSLNSNSFGSYTNQFDNMIEGILRCTVHFPSNLESVIGSWDSVTEGFGGIRTTVLFDLPATS